MYLCRPLNNTCILLSAGLTVCATGTVDGCGVGGGGGSLSLWACTESASSCADLATSLFFPFRFVSPFSDLVVRRARAHTHTRTHSCATNLWPSQTHRYTGAEAIREIVYEWWCKAPVANPSLSPISHSSNSYSLNHNVRACHDTRRSEIPLVSWRALRRCTSDYPRIWCLRVRCADIDVRVRMGAPVCM